MDRTDDRKQHTQPTVAEMPIDPVPAEQDHRRYPRFHTSLFVRCEGEKNLKEFRGNVSAGGFCFQTEEAKAPDPGKSVELLFRLPGAGIWISARGLILGCTPDKEGQGVRGCFTEIDQGSLALLNQWECFISRLRGEA